MIKWLVGFVLCSVILLAVYLYLYLGAYKSVLITQESRLEMHFLWQEHMGQYHKIGPVIANVERWAMENNISCSKTFGEYLDNPAAVDHDRLRSRGGCLLLRSIPAPENMQVSSRPAGKYVVARFSGSPAIGPFKVYPAVQRYIQEQRLHNEGPTLEIYSIHGAQVETEFLFPLKSEDKD